MRTACGGPQHRYDGHPAVNSAIRIDGIICGEAGIHLASRERRAACEASPLSLFRCRPKFPARIFVGCAECVGWSQPPTPQWDGLDVAKLPHVRTMSQPPTATSIFRDAPRVASSGMRLRRRQCHVTGVQRAADRLRALLGRRAAPEDCSLCVPSVQAMGKQTARG